MGRTTEATAPPASPQKKRQRKQEKEKGKARAPVQAGGQAGPSHVAATGSTEGVGEDGEWSWLSITDASPSRQPPVFTKDGSYFFSILGSSVKVYSVATGAIVSTLSSGAPGSHTGAITSVILNPHNLFQLITGSLDGHIKVWDFLDAVLLQTISVEQPIHFLVAHELFKDAVFVSAVRRKKNKATGKQGSDDDGLVLCVSLLPTPETAGQDIQKSAEVTLVGKTRLARGLAVSPSGAWLVAVAGHKAYVASTANLKDGFTKFVSPEALTCLAFHPSEEYFATGDEKGTVRIWYCLSSDMTAQTVAGVEKRAPTTTLHWHAHAVSGLTFTPNGAYLLSGGEESVMVIWQLHTGKKEFVPRVGAPILNISVSRARQEEYLLGLADASFVFVNSASLKVARAFSRIKLDPSISASASLPSSTPLAVHTPSQTIILPSSHASSLQSYSPSRMKLVAELEVSPSNRVSRRDEKALQPSAVERAVISSSGDWMATVDVREGDDAFRGEAYLKIWHWEKTSGFWELNTRVDRPHGLSALTAVAFSSEPIPLLVTTGRDGYIKTWRLKSVNEKRSGNTERFWVLRSTFTFREETPSHAAWSPDGSLLAVLLGPYVAIYDAVSSMLIQALTASESCASVVSAYFLGASGRYLATVGQRDVLLWDLISQQVVWHARTEQSIGHAVAHPSEDCIAVFEQPKAASHEAQTTRVSIFDANSPEPLKRVTLPFHLRSSVWYPPSSPDHQATSFCLVGVTEKYRVVLFGDEVLSITDPGASSNGLAGESSKQANTLFQDIFGKSAFADVSVGPSTSLGVTREKSNNVADLLDVPAYLLPSVDTIFDTVMGSFLQPRPAEDPTPPKQPEATSEDVHMEVEEHTSARSFVEDEEIGMLIHFFRDVAVKGPYDPNAPFPVKGNAHFGVPPPIKRKKDKDRSKPRPPPTTPPQDSYPSPESTPSLTAVPPATAGKKRRKSQAS